MCRAKKRQARSRTVHNVESRNESSDNETENYLFRLSSLNAMTSQPKIRIHVNEHPVNTLIDMRSSINVMDESTYKSMKQKPKLYKSDTKVYAYGANENVSLLGSYRQRWKRLTKLPQRRFTSLKVKVEICFHTQLQ